MPEAQLTSHLSMDSPSTMKLPLCFKSWPGNMLREFKILLKQIKLRQQTSFLNNACEKIVKQILKVLEKETISV